MLVHLKPVAQLPLEHGCGVLQYPLLQMRPEAWQSLCLVQVAAELHVPLLQN